MQRFGAAVAEQMLELAQPIGRVHRLHDRAKLVDRKPDYDEFGNVWQMDGNDVATPDAKLLERGGDGVNASASAA